MNRVILPPADIVGLFEGQTGGREHETGAVTCAEGLRPFVGKHPVFTMNGHEHGDTSQPVPVLSLGVEKLFSPTGRCFTAALDLCRYPTHVGFVAKAKDAASEGPMRAFPSEYAEERDLAQTIDRNLAILVGILTTYYRRELSCKRPHVAKASFCPPALLREIMGTHFQQFPNPDAVNCVSVRADRQSVTEQSPIDGLLLIPTIRHMNSTSHFNSMISGIVLGTSSRS